MGRLVEFKLRHGQTMNKDYTASVSYQELLSAVVQDILNRNTQIIKRLEKPTQTVRFRIDEIQQEQLSRIADHYKITTTELLRIAVEECNLLTQP